MTSSTWQGHCKDAAHLTSATQGTVLHHLIPFRQTDASQQGISRSLTHKHGQQVAYQLVALTSHTCVNEYGTRVP
jgi:hypothetical protein